MNEIDLKTKIEGLEKAITEHKDYTGTYENQLKETQKELADYNKPELTPEQFDDIYEAIEEGIESFDFSDPDKYEIEYGIDYDGRVNCETHDFNNTSDLVSVVVKSVSKLFAEATCPEDEEPTNEQLEQPVESQPVVEEIPQAEKCESEVTTTKPSETDIADLNKRAQEKKEEKENNFKKRTWF